MLLRRILRNGNDRVLFTRHVPIQQNQFLLLSPLYSSAQFKSRCSAPSSVPPPHCLNRAAAARSIFSGVHVCRGPRSLTLPGNSTVNDSASAMELVSSPDFGTRLVPRRFITRRIEPSPSSRRGPVS